MIEIIPEIEDMTPEVAAESIDTVVEVKKNKCFMTLQRIGTLIKPA